MTKPEFLIKTMEVEDLVLAIRWAKNEGWNPGLGDAEAFYKADPSGFFTGFLSGVPVGCISAVRYGSSFGFLGLYIVRPEYRGKGYGMRMWEHALKYLGKRNIGLDGVIARQKDYEKYGFKYSYTSRRYRGKAFASSRISREIVNLADVAFEKLAGYDSTVFPAKRRAFLSNWILYPRSRAFGYESGRNLSGYGVIRPCGNGHKVGPLFADDAEIAAKLFSALVYSIKGDIFIDVPDVNREGLEMAEKMNMDRVFETVRMYNLKMPNIAIDKIFGVTTLELG